MLPNNRKDAFAARTCFHDKVAVSTGTVFGRWKAWPFGSCGFSYASRFESSKVNPYEGAKSYCIRNEIKQHELATHKQH